MSKYDITSGKTRPNIDDHAKEASYSLIDNCPYRKRRYPRTTLKANGSE